MTALLDMSQGWHAPTPVDVSALGLPACHSCGKPGSVQLRQGVYCGRCAWLACGDTLGVIAAVVMDLGAS